MHLETFPTGPLGCNCSIVMDPASKRAIVIDPGGDLETIRARLTALEASVEAVVHTHTHIDHVGATAGVQSATGARACIHEASVDSGDERSVAAIVSSVWSDPKIPPDHFCARPQVTR